MRKYFSSIILAIIFAAAVWAVIYEKNRAADSSASVKAFWEQK